MLDHVPPPLQLEGTSTSLTETQEISVQIDKSTVGRGVVSISLGTLSVLFYVSFVLALSASLIALSAKFADELSSINMQASEGLRSRLLNLTMSSNELLIDASGSSMGLILEQLFLLINEKSILSILGYIEKTELCTSQMHFFWSKGDFSESDLDRSYELLWDYMTMFPDVTGFYIAGVVSGSYVGVYRLPDGTYGVELRNNNSVCTVCDPEAVASDKYYYIATEKYQTAGLRLVQHKPYDPRARSWYLDAVAANGTSVWTDPYAFTSGTAVGMSMTTLTKDRLGKVLGVIGNDLVFDFFSSFLRGLRQDLVNTTWQIGPAEFALAERGLHFAILDHQGIVLGSSSDDPLMLTAQDGTVAPAHWSLLVRMVTLRQGLELINASVGGDWRKAMAGGFEMLREDKDMLWATRSPFVSAKGLRLVLVSVCPIGVYLGQFSAAINASVQRVDQLSADTKRAIESRRAEDQLAQTSARNTFLVVAGIMTAAASFIVYSFARTVSGVLARLGNKMRDVSQLDFDVSGRPVQIPWPVGHVTEVATIACSFRDMEISLRSFHKYVPSNVVRTLSSEGKIARLGVAAREVSIMFSDIRGFTDVSERLDPQDLIAILSEYLHRMTACIEESHGTVGKFIGDGIMAFWNSPLDVPNHEKAACASALAQQRALAQMRQAWKARGLPELEARIGLSCGEALHGNIGSRNRMEWGLIGDEVNLASRLESMGKYYGVGIMLSGAMHKKVHDQFLTRRLDRVVAVGKKQPTEVFELVAHRSEATEEQTRDCEEFEEIVEGYRRRDFDRCLRLASAYDTSRSERGGDAAARIYVERCADLVVRPSLNDGWDGTHVLTHK